jgi:lipoate-protein ligase A
MSLPAFGFVAVHEEPLAAGVACEAEWMARAASNGRAAAHLWSAPAGLVVPRAYERLPGWPAARAAAAAAGWPLQVRSSGGGIVPQGPGVLNLSLVWPSESAAPSDTVGVYRTLCARLAAALARLGIPSTPQTVEGSFCDGRYNLAFGGRKLVGTAQSWRRIERTPVVLAHAVIVVSGDPQALTDRANAFESAAGSDRRYRADALTSVAQAWCAVHDTTCARDDLPSRLITLIAEQFAVATPPLTSREP